MKLNNKTKYCLLFFFSLLVLTILQLLNFGSRLDYYWNFNFSLQISNGLIPYKDISMIITPLFPFIGSIPLLFSKSIVIYAIGISLIKLLHIYINCRIISILCNKYKKKNKNIYILLGYLISIIFMSVEYYDYNMFSSLFISLIIYRELIKDDSIKNNIIIGILSGLCLLSKQSIGLFVILFALLKTIIFKENKKDILYRSLGLLIPLVVFILYLLIFNIFDDFISYCILGISEFSNHLSFIDTIFKGNILHILVLLFFIIYFIRQLYLLFIKKLDSNRVVILYYGISTLSCLYPIRDYIHLLVPFITFIPLYIISLIKIKNRIKLNTKFINYSLIIILLSLSIITIFTYGYYYLDKSSNKLVLKDNYSSINGMVVNSTLKTKIDDILNYENTDNSVRILSNEAVIYHLANNKYYKDYDMFNKGNFGDNGESRLLNEIKSSNNIKYLINIDTLNIKEYSYQLPKNIINYIMNNFNNIGKINIYTIYEKNID